ncbi:MAG: hypothetical protein E6G34_09770 [Actinobacteria bacterium]|nr:MAG: hypothetical protein E6G34_09770 [Actinomycetota bacterium]
MAQSLFLFMQMEFPWELGPPDGRYLLRAEPGGEAEHVIVLATLAASRRGPGRGRSWPGAVRSRPLAAQPNAAPEPALVATSRASIIDPVPVSAERQARAWLEDLDPEEATRDAFGVLNRVLHLHRIAAADPYVHEVSADQALVIRAGWGEGEHVADGRWLHAREISWRSGPRPGLGRGRARTAALRPQERFAELLGARGSALLCESFALRSRLDLDHSRLALAAVELQAAFSAATAELRAEQRPDLEIRMAELEKLGDGVAAQARRALAADGELPNEEIVRHALERLEAALRARTIGGR